MVIKHETDLALSIARKYEYLIGERDENDMTALQLLACNPSAFKIWGAQGSLKRFIYSRMLLTFSFMLHLHYNLLD